MRGTGRPLPGPLVGLYMVDLTGDGSRVSMTNRIIRQP